MSTTLRKKHTDLAKMLITILVVAFVAVIAILVSGCSSTAVRPDPKASAASKPSPQPVEKPVSNTHAFGESVTFDDGLSISVSLPSAYTPTEYAGGVTAGQAVLSFEFVITNGTKDAIDPSLTLATAASAGTEASGVFDTENNVGFPPATAVLPGQTVKWIQAWSVADINNVTMEVSPGFVHDAQIFTNVK